MVTRYITIPAGAITLEGALDLPAGTGPFPAAVLCHPHPLYGGDLDNNVIMAVARGLVARSVAALRFNFRGVGGSGGRHDGGQGEQEDVRAALAFAAALPEIDATRINLCGYSFGAAMAAAVCDVAGRALALVALPLATSGAPSRDPGAALAGYPGPVLLMAGDRDHVCPPDALRALAAALGSRAEVVVVPGVDHFWVGRDRELEEHAAGFLARHLAV